MLPEPGAYLLLTLFGGWIALDGAGFGQFMVSRPLVAATLAGWLVGSPAEGALLGVVLEVFHLMILQVGAARYPEGGPPAIVGGAVYAAGPSSPSLLLATVVFVLAWEWLSGESIRVLRQINGRLASLSSHPGMRSSELERRHLTAMLLDFLRGVLLVGAGIAVLSLFLALTRFAWGFGEQVPRVLIGAVLAGLLASTVRLFRGRSALFVAGAVLGLLSLLVQ